MGVLIELDIGFGVVAAAFEALDMDDVAHPPPPSGAFDRDDQVDGLADFYRKTWQSGPAGTDIPLRVIRDRRETWLRVKSASRRDYLKKPRLQ